MAVAAAAPLIMMAVTTAISAVTAISSAQQQGAAADYQAKLARRDAQLQREMAASDVGDLRRSHRRQIGTLRANAAASGLLVDDGASLEAQLASQSEAELEALRRKWSGDVSAQRHEGEAIMYEARAREARTSGYFRAGASLLTGASRAYGMLGGGMGGGGGGMDPTAGSIR